MIRRLTFLCVPMLLCTALVATAVADTKRDIIQELDEDGIDAAGIARRLTKVDTILDKADNRLDALIAAHPPGPTLSAGPMCEAAVIDAIDAVAIEAEGIVTSAAEADICATPDSIARRLGHVASSLDAANARLEGIAAVLQPLPAGDTPSPGAQPPPIGDRSAINAQLDAIIAQANALLDAAETLRSTPVPDLSP